MCEHKPAPHILYSIVYTTNLELWVGKCMLMLVFLSSQSAHRMH